MKRCNACGIAKASTAFTRRKTKNGTFILHSECKECSCIRVAKHYKKETEVQKLKRKSLFMQRTYGISLEDYNDMFIKQNGLCLGCKKHQSQFNKSFSVDHCHKTLKVRGLLCSGCNLAVGNTKEKPETLRNLAIYLEGGGEG